MNLRHTTVLLAGLALSPLSALADSGFYLGASAGGATLEINPDVPPIPDFPSEFEEDDTAFKVFGGYMFDLPIVNLGLEVGYVDFGEADIDTNLDQLVYDPTGINLWGIAEFELGPVDLFGKVGAIVWDVETTTFAGSSSDDGTDFGFGLGLGFNIGKVQIRGEYELYDTSGTELSMLSMLSLGVAYQF